MGLLDGLLSMATGAAGQSADPKAQLLNAALGMLNNGSSQGGLSGLVQAFNQNGMGDTVASWIGTGQNAAINPDQLSQVLGSGQLSQLAQQTGLSQGDVASHLSEMLPGLVDKLTPNGQMPEGGVSDALGMLQGMFGNK